MLKKYYSKVLCLCYNTLYADTLRLREAYLRNVSFNVCKGNNLKLSLTTVQNTKFRIYGNNNRCVIERSPVGINGCSIMIDGTENSLTIDEGAHIRNTNITIHGTGCNVHIGSSFSMNSGMIVCMGCKNYINIGIDCMFAENVNVWSTDSHQITDMRGNVLNRSLPVTIEDHVWLGNGSSVLKGVTIGHDSIVGMDSVITKDLKPNAIYVGNPARLIREAINWRRNQCEI